MKCPVCRETLVSLEYADVEVDWCACCGGVWLDRGELEYLVELAGGDVSAMTASGPVRSGERRRRCPVCRRRMGKVRLGGELLDRCARHGIWFDARELEALIKGSGGDELVGTTLGEMFAATGGKT